MKRQVKEQNFRSFDELRKAFGLKPISKKTHDAAKLSTQQEAFCSKHKCKACGQPMVWVPGTNIMRCENPECKGIKREYTDTEGNTMVSYKPSFDLLDTKGAEIATNIFS